MLDGITFQLVDNHHEETLGGCECHATFDLDTDAMTLTLVGDINQVATLQSGTCPDGPLVFLCDPDGSCGMAGTLTFTLTPCGIEACGCTGVPSTLTATFSDGTDDCTCLNGLVMTLTYGSIFVGTGPTEYPGWTSGESVASGCADWFAGIDLGCIEDTWQLFLGCGTGTPGAQSGGVLTVECDPFSFVWTGLTVETEGTACCSGTFTLTIVGAEDNPPTDCAGCTDNPTTLTATITDTGGCSCIDDNSPVTLTWDGSAWTGTCPSACGGADMTFTLTCVEDAFNFVMTCSDSTVSSSAVAPDGCIDLTYAFDDGDWSGGVLGHCCTGSFTVHITS